MVTSTIKLFQCDITPEKNAMIDSIGTYLATKNSLTINNFQYQKILQEKIIKLDMDQANVPNFAYNYVSITNNYGGGVKNYYYFIISVNWKSANTVELQLSLDTINTFQTELKRALTNRTNITRQHKDRFVQAAITSSTTKLFRAIDEYSEGINPVKYDDDIHEITVSDSNYNWYLIYKKKAVTEGTPLECYCVADTNLYTYFAPESAGVKYDQLTEGTYTVFYSRDNGDFTYVTSSGKSYEIGVNKKYKAVGLHRQTNQNSMSVYLIMDNQIGGNSIVTDDTKNGNLRADTNYTGVVLQNQNLVGYQFSNTATSSNILTLGYNNLITLYNSSVEKTKFIIAEKARDIYFASIYDVDRTDSTIVKIIKMPYAPFEISYTTVNGKKSFNIPDSWSLDTTVNMLKLTSLDQEFLTTLPEQRLYESYVLFDQALQSNWKNIQNDRTYESKLYHSDYYSPKYCYDNFTKEFYLERFNFTSTGNIPAIGIQFKQSNNISSNSLFKFSSKNGIYHEPIIYGQYLNVNRQNEIALYSDSYLDYIRNGYNYDLKNKTIQNVTSGIGTGISLIGAVGAFSSSIVTGGAGVAAGISFATSAIASLTSSIANAMQSEAAIQQKLDNEAKKPSSVSNTTDLNLLSYYNGNRLLSYSSSISERTALAIYQLFRLTGYACNDYGIPNFNSRAWYNFIQCSPVFDDTLWKYNREFLKDIEARFKIGITVYHNVDGEYDIAQEEENFETWIVR